MFIKFEFSQQQIDNYLQAAKRDLIIATSQAAEVKFQFSYNCLLKLAQAVCAANSLRVRAQSGHHIALLEKFSNILNNKKIIAVAQAMRDKRNRDLYDGGIIITNKEAQVYYEFVKDLWNQVNEYLATQRL